MTDVTAGLVTLSTGRSVSASDGDSWDDVTCPHCQAGRMIRVAYTTDTGPVRPDSWRWLFCAACRHGAVSDGDGLSPTPKPMREPAGLPEVDHQIWNEARLCLGVGANAAAVMLCRKLLFHIAVAQGLPAKNARDRAPSFAEAVAHLEDEGVVTKKMRPWVERIKDVGNDANHELEPVSAKVAIDVAAFTEQLLVLAYELDALMGDPTIAG